MLFPHQQEALEFLLKNQRVILADSPRIGKTLPAAAAALTHLPALIVCPAIVKNVWATAFTSLNDQKSIRVISGKKDAENVGGADIVIINYDLLSSIKALGKFQTLVLDEAHRIRSRGAKRSKAALKLMAKIPKVYALTGTPVVNRHEDLFNLLKGLGIYRGTWSDYAVRYCGLFRAAWGWDSSRSTNAPELRELVKPYMLRRTKDQVFVNYEKPAYSLITFDIPVDKREKQFDADALLANPGAMLTFDGLQEVLKEGGLRKVKECAEFIGELLDSEEPVIVFTIHHEVTAALAEKLASYKPNIINGTTSAKAKNQYVADFQSGKTNLIIGNEQSMGEGVDLSRASTIVFVQNSWSTASLEQCASRIENINKPAGGNTIYLLTTKNSLDHTILRKVLKKMNIAEQIL